MASRTIIGNLAADPEIVQAGSIEISKFRVIENTGDYRRGEFAEHDTPTTHFVEARFELGENVAALLESGMAVIVVGREHISSWVLTTTSSTAASCKPATSAPTWFAQPQQLHVSREGRLVTTCRYGIIF